MAKLNFHQNPFKIHSNDQLYICSLTERDMGDSVKNAANYKVRLVDADQVRSRFYKN